MTVEKKNDRANFSMTNIISIKISKYNIFYYTLTALLLFILPFLLIPKGYILYNNDWEYLGLNPAKQLSFIESSWSVYSQGFNLFQGRYIAYYILNFIYSFFNNFEIYQRFIIGVLFVLQFIFFSYFLSLFKFRNFFLKNIILPLFFVFNLYTLINWQFGYIQILIIYTLIPLFVSLLYKIYSSYYLHRKIDTLKIVLLAMITPLFSVSIPDISPHLVLGIAILILNGIFFIRKDIRLKFFIITINVLLAIFFIIPNLYWIVNYFYFWSSPTNRELISTVSDLGYFTRNFQYSTLLYQFRGLGWLLKDSQGRYFTQLISLYNENIFFIITGFFVYTFQPTLLLLYSEKHKKIILFLIIIYLTMLGFVMGFREPFGFINHFLYDIGFYQFFRNAYVKTMIFWGVVFIPILYYWFIFLYKKNVKIFKIILFINIIYIMTPLFTDAYFNYTVIQPNPNQADIRHNSTIKIPYYYDEFNAKFNSYDDINSILYVPISNVYYFYDWGYGGASIVKYYLPTTNNVYGQYDPTDQIVSLWNGNFDAIKDTDINYILFDKHTNDAFFDPNNVRLTNDFVSFLKNSNLTYSIDDTKDYTIFHLKNNNKIQMFNAEKVPLSVDYVQLKPTKYNLFVSKDTKSIILYNKFDNNWILKDTHNKYYAIKENRGYNSWNINVSENQNFSISYVYQERFDLYKPVVLYYYLSIFLMFIILIYKNYQKMD